MTSRPDRPRAIAVSTLAASRETFTPRRLLYSPLLAAPRAALRTCRAALGAIEQLPSLVARVAGVLAAVELLVARIDGTSLRADGVVDRAAITGLEADATVSGVLQLEKRVTTLIDRCEPLLSAITELDPGTVRAFQALIVELQPLLAELHDAVPDVRGILPVVRRLEPVMVDVETRFAGLPGAGRLRERGERVIEDARSDEQ